MQAVGLQSSATDES